jgi:spore coat polysaccharide biosynthesis protein SpsF (cytidylyltransferase family)
MENPKKKAITTPFLKQLTQEISDHVPLLQYKSATCWPIGVDVEIYTIDAIKQIESCFTGTINIKYDWYDSGYIKIKPDDFKANEYPKPEL